MITDRYTFPIRDGEKIKKVHIPYFARRRVSEIEHHLDFFTYVIRNKVSSLGNFDNIIHESQIRGTVIYAKNLLRLGQIQGN